MPPPPGEDFAFQTTATSLRGYKQNSRRGNTFGLVNAEVRAPIFTNILKRPIQSSFIKNLQATAFIDVGSAWNGWVPNTDNLNQPYLFYNPPNPVYVSVVPPENGVAIGYGAGLRTMLFGYFMRVDAAWNIEGSTKPLWHFSIGTDF
jgi:outer membrane protein assembly factor BamA